MARDAHHDSPAEILAFARQHDPEACWWAEGFTDVLLIAPGDAARAVLLRYTRSWEDPNPPGTPVTRIDFGPEPN